MRHPKGATLFFSNFGTFCMRSLIGPGSTTTQDTWIYQEETIWWWRVSLWMIQAMMWLANKVLYQAVATRDHMVLGKPKNIQIVWRPKATCVKVQILHDTRVQHFFGISIVEILDSMAHEYYILWRMRNLPSLKRGCKKWVHLTLHIRVQCCHSYPPFSSYHLSSCSLSSNHQVPYTWYYDQSNRGRFWFWCWWWGPRWWANDVLGVEGEWEDILKTFRAMSCSITHKILSCWMEKETRRCNHSHSQQL